MSTLWKARIQEDVVTSQPNATPQSFQQAIHVEAVQGTDNCYTAFAEPSWCGYAGVRAFGGWTNSVILHATRKYFSSKHASRAQPDAIGITTHYLRPLPSGRVDLVIRDIRIGRARSVVQVDVQQGQAPDAKTCTLATVTHGNLAAEEGVTVPADKLPVPDLADCDPLLIGLVRRMVPAMAHVVKFTPRGGPSALWTPSVGRNARDFWVRFAQQPSGWDLVSLGYASDLCAPILWNYQDSAEAGIRNWDIRTMSISVDIRRDPRGEKWLLQRAVMHEARNGRCDAHIQIINPKGELVAVVYQINIAIPTSKRSVKEQRGGGQLSSL